MERWGMGKYRETEMGIGMEPTIKVDIRPLPVYCAALYTVA